MNIRDVGKVAIGFVAGAIVTAILVYRLKPEGTAQEPIEQPVKHANHESQTNVAPSPQVGFSPSLGDIPAAAPKTFIACDQLLHMLRFLGNGVALTAEENERVQLAFNDVYLQRLVLERQSALVTESSDRRVVIRIPSYSGTWLRDNFYAQLSSALSSEKVQAVKTHYGYLVERLNEGFGNHPKDIVVNSLPDGYYDITTRTLDANGSAIEVTHSQLQNTSLDAYVVLSSLFPQPTND